MSKEKEFVKDITNIDDDFAQWYTDIVLKAELADYTAVKGFIAIRPYGYSIWENIQAYADMRFKEHGVKNVSMPVLIPESLLNKEKDHVEGFAPEVAWVTIGGGEKLEERLCVRPTSETIFSTMYSKWSINDTIFFILSVLSVFLKYDFTLLFKFTAFPTYIILSSASCMIYTPGFSGSSFNCSSMLNIAFPP